MSDNISTNTIFHFTASIDNLESILKNDFYPLFVFEDFFGTISSIPGAEKAIPMVCFCDIPLSQVRKHIKTYGEYAIGLSKEWAVRMKINPVLYTYKGSDFAVKLYGALNNIIARERQFNINENRISDQLVAAMHYVKPYEGVLWRHGQWMKDGIRFYDEREWRYLQPFKGTNEPIMIKKEREDSSEEDLKMLIERLNKSIIDTGTLRLSFQPNDIKFIIVRDESEILKMVDKVINIKREKFSYKDVQILTTRIISMESIKENF
jgi:Putative abortive phage resistance protein AbiGi, antitoxin